MANEIPAAIIQAVPVAIAALVAGRGLSTWRTQLREGRQVEHAEQALATAAPMFGAIRAARSRFMSLPSDSVVLKEAEQHETQERLNRAWNAFASFQERYVLAGLYAQEDRQMDVAAQVGDCLSELRQHARMMWAFEAIGDRVASTKEREAFYGPAVILPFAPQPDDPIEARLKRAEQALQSELRPILALKTRQGRLRRILATRRGK